MTYYLRWPTPKKFFDFDLKYCNRYMNLQEATDFQKYHFVTLVRINFGCSDFKNISLVYITKRYLSKLLLYWNKNQESKLPPSLIIPIFAPISVIALVSFLNLVEYKPVADYFFNKMFHGFDNPSESSKNRTKFWQNYYLLHYRWKRNHPCHFSYFVIVY